MSEIVLDDINPRHLVSANVKLHHHAAGRLRAYWREASRSAAEAAYGVADVGESWHDRVRITVTYRFNDRRKHDVANLYNYVAKGLVDGLVDARVIPDDDDYHVLGPDPRRDFDIAPYRIVIGIEDMNADRHLEPDEPIVERDITAHCDTCETDTDQLEQTWRFDITTRECSGCGEVTELEGDI